MFLNLILVVLGLFSGLSSTFFYLIPLIIVSFTILITVTENERSLKRVFFLGWLFGFGFFLGSMHWIINPFLIYEKHYILAPFVIIIFPASLGVFFAFPTLASKFVNNSIKQEFLFLRTFITSSLFLISEIIRSKVFGGLPFNLHSHVWTFFPEFIKISSVIGTFGLSFLTIYWIIIQANFFLNKKNILPPFLSLPILLLMFSLFNKDNLKDNDGILTNIRIVQPNIPQIEKWNRGLIPSHIEKILYLSTKDNDIDKNKTRIVVWPEVAVPFYLNEEDELISYIRSELSDNTVLITGGLRRDFSEKHLSIFNSFYIIDKKNIKFYDKKKLVPFGEFIPLKNIFGLSKITEGSTDFSVGLKDQNISMHFDRRIVQVEPSICFESIFQSFPVISPDILVNLTNDAWFGNTIGPRQHLAASIFRAVEKGIPLIRSANSGISAFVSSEGKVVKKIKLNESGYIDLKLSLSKSSTVFTRYKNYTILVLLSFFLIFSVIGDFLYKRKFN